MNKIAAIFSRRWILAMVGVLVVIVVLVIGLNVGRLLERSKTGTEYVSPYEIATVYAGLGETDRAFEWLEKAFEDWSTMLQ